MLSLRLLPGIDFTPRLKNFYALVLHVQEPGPKAKKEDAEHPEYHAEESFEVELKNLISWSGMYTQKSWLCQ